MSGKVVTKKNVSYLQKTGAPDFQEVSKHLIEMGDHAQSLAGHYAKRAQSGEWPKSPWNPWVFQGAFVKAFEKIAQHPEKALEATHVFLKDIFALNATACHRHLKKEAPLNPVIEPSKNDRRFQHESWSKNPFFDHIKQSYLLWDRWVLDVMTSAPDLDPSAAQQVAFLTKQFTDSFSPNNFMHLNPEVLKCTMDSGGMNLLSGLNHFLEDMKEGQGFLKINMVDKSAFELGKTLATTPGKVIFQNELIQLIQYTPTTSKVHQIPVLLVPPCINKFYIYDLKPENSFVKWILDQGFAVFIISWINPDHKMAHKTFEDYAVQGIGQALKSVAEVTKSPKVNAVGFCIGGNILTFYSAYAAHKKETYLNSLTFLATPFDFSKVGDLQVFINEAQLTDLEKHMEKKGYFDGSILAKTFNMLRSNDLIWSFVINNYLMGKDPAAFDILYWNGDATRLPAAMYIYYLKNLFLHNKFMQPGALKAEGHPIDLSNINVPTYILNTHRDHIIPWECGYAGASAFSGSTTFVLGGSGHVAGIFNHPSANKYCYWVNSDTQGPSQRWLQKAQAHQGSWWPHWSAWVAEKSGPIQGPYSIGSKEYPPLEDAPGSYVMEMNSF